MSGMTSPSLRGLREAERESPGFPSGAGTSSCLVSYGEAKVKLPERATALAVTLSSVTAP
jgi:hypothetical protein